MQRRVDEERSPGYPRHMLNRRDCLAGLVSAAGAGLLTSKALAAAPPTEPASSNGLDAIARKRGLRFGCAVRQTNLDAEPDLRAAILREAGMLVPENEMKWRPLQPEKTPSNFGPADRIAGFAAENGLLLRGHTLVWHQNPPAWAVPELTGAAGAKLMLDHVHDVAGHYKGRVVEWDVVNEAIWPIDERPGDLRNFSIYNEGGFDFLADCFKAAHAADENAKLYYNDFGLEYSRYQDGLKRRATLRLVEELLKRNAPIHGFGIQSHLVLGSNFDEAIFRRFLADVASMGLAIRLTEFDVNDRFIAGSVEVRDETAASAAKAYLDVCFDEPAVNGLLTWGLTDRFTWLNDKNLRRDGLPQRGLPLDADYLRKPLWQAIATALDSAPARR